jgi:hypothetical protein
MAGVSKVHPTPGIIENAHRSGRQVNGLVEGDDHLGRGAVKLSPISR